MRSVTSWFPCTGKSVANPDFEPMRHPKKDRAHDQAHQCLMMGPAFCFAKRLMVVAGCLVLVVAFSGCATLRVHQMQRRAAQGDDAWIVAQSIDCDTPSPSCGHLHLIKGNACLRMAEKNRERVTDYACASDELAKAIALTPSWENLGKQLETSERYCDALDGLQRLQSGKAADDTRERLWDAAQSLYQLAPKSVPATYYISVARLRQLTARISTIDVASRLPVCSRLKRMVNQVLSLMETARHDRLPNWDRFAERYQRLAFELGEAMQAAECR